MGMNVSCRPVAIADIEFLMSLYSDPVVIQQLYLAPQDETEFARWAIQDHRYIVESEGESIATFTIVPSGYTANVGIAVVPSHRKSGFGQKIMELVEQAAKKKGVRTLVADIYSSNEAAIATFQKANFSEVVWYEKNL